MMRLHDIGARGAHNGVEFVSLEDNGKRNEEKNVVGVGRSFAAVGGVWKLWVEEYEAVERGAGVEWQGRV